MRREKTRRHTTPHFSEPSEPLVGRIPLSKGDCMFKRSLAGLSLLIFCSVAWSQSMPSVEVFGGYSYTPANFTYLKGGSQGWNAAASFKAYRWIGFKADFAQYYFSDSFGDHSTTTTYLFGPVVSIPVPLTRITPFGQFLFGGASVGYHYNMCSSCPSPFQNPNQFVWMLGGGLDYRLSTHFALRAEGDYLHTHLLTADNQLQSQIQNSHPRFSTGLVFRF
jgi:opacity protein-like surface antigen